MDFNFWPNGTVGSSSLIGENDPALIDAITKLANSKGYKAAFNKAFKYLSEKNSSRSVNVINKAIENKLASLGIEQGASKTTITNPLRKGGALYTKEKLDALGLSQGDCPVNFYELGPSSPRLYRTPGERLKYNDNGRRITKPGTRELQLERGKVRCVQPGGREITIEKTGKSYRVPLFINYRPGDEYKPADTVNPVNPVDTVDTVDSTNPVSGFFEAYNMMPGVLYKGSVGNTQGNAQTGWSMNQLLVGGLIGIVLAGAIVAGVRGKINIFSK